MDECPGCQFEANLLHIVRQHAAHNHELEPLSERFERDLRLNDEGLVGRRFDFPTSRNPRENGNEVISKMRDGKIVLFHDKCPLTLDLKPDQRVRGIVVKETPTYVLAAPESILGPTEAFDIGLAEPVED